MDSLVKQIIEEKFASKKQQRYFYHKAKKSKKWAKMAKEFSDKTDFSKLPEKAEEEVKKDVDEIVDADGNIKHGDQPGNLNAYITAKKTTDDAVSGHMGQMGTFGILGGPGANPNKTIKYWAESDMSKALGADETIADPKTGFEDAVDHFEELEVPEDEAKERAKQMGYDPQLPDGKMRLIENPLEYIKEYLAKKTKKTELVKKNQNEMEKKAIAPIIKRQLQSMKEVLKNNNLTVQDITEYLEDNE